MKYVRYVSSTGTTYYGVLDGENVKRIEGDLFSSEYSITEETEKMSDVKLLAPCEPSKIVCVGANYMAHIKEAQQGLAPTIKIPERPALFLKGPNTIAGPEDEIEYPTGVDRLDFEGEFTIVIGKRCRKATEENALDYVLGYTCANDVSARDWQLGDIQWYRGKGLDRFCPFGPVISDEANPEDSYIKTYLNGELMQDSNINDLCFGIRHLIHFTSQWITLEPGDIILTGTPSGVAPMHPGDKVEIEIENVGILRNYIIEAQ